MKHLLLVKSLLVFFLLFSFNTVKTDEDYQIPGNKTWESYDIKAGRCSGIELKKIKIEADGNFFIKIVNKHDGWTGYLSGNLLNSTAKNKTPKGERMSKFKAVRVNNDWALSYRMSWSGGGCDIKYKLKIKD